MKKTAKCKYCKGTFNVEGMKKVESPSKGWFYVCNRCNTVEESYGRGNSTVLGVEKSHGCTISFEFETASRSQQSNYLMEQGFIPTSDCSIGGTEWNSPIWKGLSGKKQLLRSIEKYCHVDDRCGTHLNCGIKGLNSTNMQYLRRFYHSLFLPLTEKLVSDRASTIAIWGRYFQHYAEKISSHSNPADKYNWVNVKHRDWVEFRLARFQNAEQYFKLMQFACEVMKILETNFLKYASDQNIELTKHKAKIAGNKILMKYNSMFKLD